MRGGGKVDEAFLSSMRCSTQPWYGTTNGSRNPGQSGSVTERSYNRCLAGVDGLVDANIVGSVKIAR